MNKSLKTFLIVAGVLVVGYIVFSIFRTATGFKFDFSNESEEIGEASEVIYDYPEEDAEEIGSSVTEEIAETEADFEDAEYDYILEEVPREQSEDEKLISMTWKQLKGIDPEYSGPTDVMDSTHEIRNTDVIPDSAHYMGKGMFVWQDGNDYYYYTITNGEYWVEKSNENVTDPGELVDEVIIEGKVYSEESEQED